MIKLKFWTLVFEKKLMEKFWNTIRPNTNLGTGMIYTSFEWNSSPDENGDISGGFIHVSWNKLNKIMWQYFNQLRIRYYLLILISFFVGVLVGNY